MRAPEVIRKAIAMLRQSPLAVLVLVLGLVLTFSAWCYVANHAEKSAREQFLIHADDAKDNIVRRMNVYIEILHGASGLFHASGQVTRSEWRKYVESLSLPERFPGIQGMGFIRLSPRLTR